MWSRSEREWSGPLFDAHVHVGRSLFGLEQSVDDLLASMDGAGVTRAVIVPFKPPAYELGPENDRIARAVREHANRFHGFARVDPWQREGALAELRRAHRDLGLQGLYLHPSEEQFAANDELVFPLLAYLQEHGLPLLLAGGYPGYAHPSQVGDLARQFPEVTIIVTHGGQLNNSGLLLGDAGQMLRAHPNLIMETSGIYRQDFIEDTVAELGAHRVLFGSNAPAMDQGFESLRVRLAHLSDTDKNAIAYGTMARILGILDDVRSG